MTTRYTVRPVRAHEWREIKALRLRALSDEAAPMAFLESYGEAEARPDGFWQERAQGSAADAGARAGARQFVAVTDDGTWVGTAAALVEEAGDVDFEGRVVEAAGGHVVGVFLLPEHRGREVMGSLLEAIVDTAGTGAVPRAALRPRGQHPGAAVLREVRVPAHRGAVHRHDGARDRDGPRSPTP